MSSEGTTKGIGPFSYEESDSEDDSDSISSCSEDSRSDSREADCFSTISLEHSTGPDESLVESGPAGQFETVEGMELGLGGMEMGLEDSTKGLQFLGCTKTPKGRSIGHHLFSAGTAAFLSFDFEAGGEYAGIIQLSAEIVRMKLVPGKGVA
jgi:hypothetical protein